MDFKSEDVKPSQQPAAPASSPHTQSPGPQQRAGDAGVHLLAAAFWEPVAPMLWGSHVKCSQPTQGPVKPLWLEHSSGFSAMGVEKAAGRRSKAQVTAGPHTQQEIGSCQAHVCCSQKASWAARKGVGAKAMKQYHSLPDLSAAGHNNNHNGCLKTITIRKLCDELVSGNCNFTMSQICRMQLK